MNINKNHRILITGACGSIGSKLVERFLELGSVVCAFDQDEDGLFKLDQMYNPEHEDKLRLFMGNIRDRARLIRAFEGVDIVFHCAAQKHVFLSEYNPFEVIKTNVLGVNNIISCALEAKVKKVIFTSSDKAVNPSSTMGVSKLLGEKLISGATYYSSNKTIFASVRFGNVLNTNGSVLKVFQNQFKNNKPITITSKDMSRYFITMSQAIDLCIYCQNNMIGGEIFISKMESFNIIDLAKVLSKGKKFDIEIIGIKAGEKTYEELVTEEESTRTVLFDGHYIIIPNTIKMMPKKVQTQYKNYIGLKKLNTMMRSDQKLMSQDQIYNLLNKNKII